MAFADGFWASVRSLTTASRKVRGFTLIELMVVVVIIAILAVIAVPLFSARLQGRRIFQVAGRMADLYRGSRTRALARGGAVVVRLNPTTDSLTVLEGVQGTALATASGADRTACGNLPTRGCLTNNWGNLGSGTVIGTARQIEGLGNEKVQTSYTIGNGAKNDTTQLDLCFSPAGRTFYNTSATWTPNAWTQLTTPLVIEVESNNPSATTPRKYSVVVMPNGTARLAL